jgi:hypothetical protein
MFVLGNYDNGNGVEGHAAGVTSQSLHMFLLLYAQTDPNLKLNERKYCKYRRVAVWSVDVYASNSIIFRPMKYWTLSIG